MKVSLHPAQTAAKPRVSEAGSRGSFPRGLDDMRLQPVDRTRTVEPVTLVRLRRLVGEGTHGLRHVHLQFSPAQVPHVLSSRTTRWKSARPV